MVFFFFFFDKNIFPPKTGQQKRKRDRRREIKKVEKKRKTEMACDWDIRKQREKGTCGLFLIEQNQRRKDIEGQEKDSTAKER